mmetsp:Transcript_25151/g.55344  ORF Transcript_25151/g.55344 Transcript_25151/m.55344 type:complete len:281 (+) Transcript_25151:221-1063(+)
MGQSKMKHAAIRSAKQRDSMRSELAVELPAIGSHLLHPILCDEVRLLAHGGVHIFQIPVHRLALQFFSQLLPLRHIPHVPMPRLRLDFVELLDVIVHPDKGHALLVFDHSGEVHGVRVVGPENVPDATAWDNLHGTPALPHPEGHLDLLRSPLVHALIVVPEVVPGGFCHGKDTACDRWSEIGVWVNPGFVELRSKLVPVEFECPIEPTHMHVHPVVFVHRRLRDHIQHRRGDGGPLDEPIKKWLNPVGLHNAMGLQENDDGSAGFPDTDVFGTNEAFTH